MLVMFIVGVFFGCVLGFFGCALLTMSAVEQRTAEMQRQIEENKK